MDKLDIPQPDLSVPRTVRAPSPRMTAALAAVMLAVGVAVGAAIGPTPTSSLAVGTHLPLLPSLLAAAGVGRTGIAVQPPATTAASTPRVRRHRVRHASSTAQPAASTNASEEASTPSSTTPASKGKAAPVKLPPVANVWLIELSGSTFASALEAPTGAPYINDQAAPTGTTLSGWSAIEASAFANDAALMATSGPQVVDTIVQPPCPDTTGAQCAAGTPGALTAADEFLKATLPTITSSATYRSSGLIVVTFSSIAAGSASGLPGGSESATLTSQPPAGALLISPFVTAGASSSTPFNPASPTQSLEKLLHS